MSEAYEVSLDDAPGVAEAIRRAPTGATVHLVRDGQPVANVVAATSPDEPVIDADDVPDPDYLAALEARMARRPESHARLVRDLTEQQGAPTLADYRKVFTAVGRPWPGEDYIRRHHPVGEAP